MAWITLKSSVSNKTYTMTESSYNNYHKHSNILEVVNQPKKEENKKPIKPTEDIQEDGENIQFTDENEVNSSGKNKKKTGV